MSEGYQEVDTLMDKVYKAIGRHLPQSSDGAVDIYNRAYETVASVYSKLAAVTAERDAWAEKWQLEHTERVRLEEQVRMLNNQIAMSDELIEEYVMPEEESPHD